MDETITLSSEEWDSIIEMIRVESVDCIDYDLTDTSKKFDELAEKIVKQRKNKRNG